MPARYSVSQFLIFTGVFCSCLAIKDGTQAQVNSDNTIHTEVNVVNNSGFTITGGTQVGNNLFHSFSEFSLPIGNSAIFDNDTNVQNIFSRVTGTSISNIDGLIQANGNANLFLLNPNGIIFGSNAELNIGGSFVATTAEQINFADGTTFSAIDSQSSPLLTVTIPVGVQFGETAKSIINRSAVEDSDGFPIGLQVKPNKNLALVGGDILLDGGSLFAPGGKIEMISVFRNSFVGFSSSVEDLTLDYDKVENFQDIYLAKEVFIDTTGVSSGSILLQGRQIAISNSQILAVNEGVDRGGNIQINASESIELKDSNLNTNTFSNGASGDITINTQTLIVKDGSFIDTANNRETRGQGGNLTVNASQSVEIDGTGRLSRLTTETFNDEDAGNLKVTTQRLILRDGGQIKSSTINFQGNGGSIAIDALESIQISGRGITLNGEIVSSGLLATTEGDTASGNAGNIKIETNNLNVREGGIISVAATDESTGRAGNIEINANSLFLNEGTITAETAQTSGETGANITLNVADSLQLKNESQISATASGSANGGNIDIDANFVVAFPSQNNDIIARALEGIGGNIDITTSGIFGISERSSTPANNTNDIDPSSDFGLDGTVNINELEINPAEGLENLPAEVIDVARLVETNLCQQGRGSEFVVTGKGGIAPSPSQTRDGNVGEVDLVEPVEVEKTFLDAETRRHGDTERIEEREEIVEAQGWIVNNKGKIQLVAHATDPNNLPPQFNNQQICPKP